jgi:hypothetical protein
MDGKAIALQAHSGKVFSGSAPAARLAGAVLAMAVNAAIAFALAATPTQGQRYFAAVLAAPAAAGQLAAAHPAGLKS